MSDGNEPLGEQLLTLFFGALIAGGLYIFGMVGFVILFKYC